jgi:imidazole glycerol-phosphate synthase subunit HisF
VIIALCFDSGLLMRTKRFRADYRYTQSYLAVDAVDEVFLIDITRGGPSEASRLAMASYAERCFAPVTMGGWVRSVGDARELFAIGADKVVISAGIMENPGLIGDLARKYGSQAVVAGLDCRQGMVETGKTGEKHDFTALEWAEKVETLGAGEIYLQDIERDGSLQGYNTEILREIAAAVSCPVVIGAGCGGWRHMADGFRSGAAGCVTSVIHHFTESSLGGFKAELSRHGLPVRVA